MDLGTPGCPRGQASPPSFHKMLNISETVQIPTHKPYIFLFLMMRRIKWHGPWILKGSPGGMPHPLYFIKCVISRKPFRSPPINHIYSCSLRYGAFSDMDFGTPGCPRVHAPPPSFYKMLNILETVQISTYKPYIFLLLMMRRNKWHGPWIPKGSPGGHAPPLHFIKYVISRKLFKSQPINHIYCCSLWQAAFSDMDPLVPRGHASLALFIKCIISWKPFRSPSINHIYSC